MNFKEIIIFDDKHYENLFPLTYMRSACEIRVGCLTIIDKWKLAFKNINFNIETTNPFLVNKYKINKNNSYDYLYINSRCLPNESLIKEIINLKENSTLTFNGNAVVFINEISENKKEIECKMIEKPHHIFQFNGEQIVNDIPFLEFESELKQGENHNIIIGNHPVYLAKGAKALASIFNTSNGPIFLDKDSEVMEGSMVKGPFYLGEHSTLKMGSKIYGDSSFGPHCKIGGEVNNSVIFGYTNKAHDGFLGNSVIAEWCNLGADTNNSNLKNNYEEVKLWNFKSNRFEKTGLQFCGLIMGDHSKCGINSMFNTGTVVGISANIFGSGFPRNFIPSFSWGGASGFETYMPDKAFKTAELTMNRRGLSFSELDKEIFLTIYENEKKYRTWETK